MTLGPVELNNLAIALLIIFASTSIGYVIEKFIIQILKILAHKTKTTFDDIVIDAIDNVIVLIFFIIGLYISETQLGITRRFHFDQNKIIWSLGILALGFFISKIITGFLYQAGKEGTGKLPSASIFGNFIKFIVLIFVGLFVLNIYGVTLTPILTALGVGGVAVALALQETLSNFISGLQVVASRKLRPRDYIKTSNGEEGYIDDITWRYTTIRTLANNTVIVPNSMIANSAVINYHRPSKDMAVLINIGVSYDSDLEKVEQVTIKVGKEIMQTIAGGVEEFEPFIRYNKFDDFSINFTVILRCQEYVDQYLITHEFIKALHKAYQNNGINIPFPITTVKMEK